MQQHQEATLLLSQSFLPYINMWLSNLLSRSTTRPPIEEAIQAEGKTDEIKQDVDTQEDTTSDSDSVQNTPKASATVAALQVPALSLEETTRRDQDVADSVSQKTPTSTNNSSSLMPPPPRITSKPPSLKPTSNTQLLGPPRLTPPAPLRTPPSAAANLRNPAGGLSTSTLAPAQRSSRKVILGPGYSPLDWASLAKDPRNNLRGSDLPPTLIKVTPSMLKAHNGRKGTDAWTSYNGKVYNITPYAPFHPGGKGELLRGAGKDSAKLFLETHPWVNWDGILGECLVGILVSENEGMQANSLDAMD